MISKKNGESAELTAGRFGVLALRQALHVESSHDNCILNKELTQIFPMVLSLFFFLQKLL